MNQHGHVFRMSGIISGSFTGIKGQAPESYPRLKVPPSLNVAEFRPIAPKEGTSALVAEQQDGFAAANPCRKLKLPPS